MGREAFRRALTQRLLPTLRAFNPDLILLSCGFDGCQGDAGNSRAFSEEWLGEVNGMDLEPQDFAWATAEIAKVADLCCEGRVISILEGGYGHGRANPAKAKEAAAAAATAADTSMDVALISPAPQMSSRTPSTGSSSSLSPSPAGATVSAHLEKLVASSTMDRQSLTSCVAAHVHRLVDPYGENRLLRSAEQIRDTSLSAAPRQEPSERDDKALSGEEDFEDEGDDGGCETDEDPPYDMKPTTL